MQQQEAKGGGPNAPERPPAPPSSTSTLVVLLLLLTNANTPTPPAGEALSTGESPGIDGPGDLKLICGTSTHGTPFRTKKDAKVILINIYYYLISFFLT
ncbi:hypothetical protein Scep_003059 [Stephania cephalantha]|uniref:Uncharacterized protein n=1 Tax=Stephania cephalantha TaxID=152367 RepID=A0AAP0KQR6_9MAGN